MSSTPTTNEAAFPTDRYWATVEPDKLPSIIRAQAERYRGRLDDLGYTDLYRRAERTMYGQDSDGGMSNSAAVTFGGENGENVMFRVNHPGSLSRSLIAMVLPKRLSYEPQASNADVESAQETVLAKSLIEAYTRTLKLEEHRVERARGAVCFGSMFLALRWNPFIGAPVTEIQRQRYDDSGMPMTEEVERPVMMSTVEMDEETGEAVETPPRQVGVERVEQPVTEPWVVREGDLEAHTLSPFEVIRDLDDASDEMPWAIIPYRANVWNLIARYPEKRVDFLKMRGTSQTRWPRSAWSEDTWEAISTHGDPDIVTEWHLRHPPCDALPTGRHAIVVGDVIVHDGDYDDPDIGLYELAHERRIASKLAHTSFWDILALADVHDALNNTAQSSIDAFGSQIVITPKDSDFNIDEVTGMKLLKYNAEKGKPEAMNFLSLPKEVTDFIEHTKVQMETIFGVNSVVRGDVPENIKSGAAMALVQSLAVESNGQFQAGIVRCDERIATGIFARLKKYAVNKRTVEIVGSAQKGAVMQWSKDSIRSIDRVTINIGTALQGTEAGKLEIANQLATMKNADGSPMIKTPQEYIEVLTTGRLEPIYRAEKAQLDLIARENEALERGEPVIAVLTDDHALHVSEHAAVLASDAMRMDQQATDRVLQHINQHVERFTAMGPVLGVLTKQSVQPPPPAPLAPPGAPAGPPPPGAGPGGPGPAAKPPEHPAGAPLPVPPRRARPLGHEPPPEGGPNMPFIAGTKTRAPNPSQG